MVDPTLVDYDGLIPNNVGLNADPRLRRALENWHPGCIDWWKERGPEGFQANLVYLRTAISVEPEGWARFGYVRMPEYRWGILLAPAIEDRRIGFGEHKDEPVWQEVPGEYRAMLRRLIVVQGDTEPASVEQQRHLGRTAPSLYDLRNLFQVNVEEARHLWAMVYLLQKYFGRDGREEAEDLLRRQSGDRDTPRLLGAFNEATRIGSPFSCSHSLPIATARCSCMRCRNQGLTRYRALAALCSRKRHIICSSGRAGSGASSSAPAPRCVSPASTTRPISTRVRALGVIDLPTIQKRINLHFSLTLDLFGNDVSTNAANAYNAGLKGRYLEDQIDDDHRLIGATYPVPRLKDGRIVVEDMPAITSLNVRLRDDYVRDAASGVERWWNRIIARAGYDFRLRLPHVAFHRHIGEFAAVHADPDGTVISDAEWQRRRGEYLPSCDDDAYVASLMRPVTEPGAFAPWIAPPRAGIDGKPGNFQYVKLRG